MSHSTHDDQLLEQASAVYDGEELAALDVHADLVADCEEHMQHWALIGSALRRELPGTIAPHLAERVMAAINTDSPSPANDHRGMIWKMRPALLARTLAQCAAAAAMAAVTVIGYQTYSAADIAAQQVYSSSSHYGSTSGINVPLASFQHPRPEIKLEDFGIPQSGAAAAHPERALQREAQQEQELRRINTYLRSYIMDSASR